MVMVRCCVTAGLLALAATGAGARTFAAQSVTITKSGQWHDDPYHVDSPRHCARFRPTSAEILHYFKKARVVIQQEWMELVWTQCSADGTVTSAGKSYHWHLDQSGRGFVGPSIDKATYLDGPELPFRPGRD